MIQKLRRHLTLLFLIPTSLILSLILFVLFFWQASLTRSEQAVNLQNQILNLTYQLEGAYFFSDDWLASLEYDHRLIIHIEDNRVPLLFSGSSNRPGRSGRAGKGAGAKRAYRYFCPPLFFHHAEVFDFHGTWQEP